ncbi:8809_t:CDS:2 [Entrophospora sp. SA101]|nr:8809_t:CDS:2 [Entrophospora sp. SA101]
MPIVPVNFRMAEHADEIDGHKFEGSTTLFINAQGIHMDKSYWKEPEKFNPERFLSTNNNKNDDKIQKNTLQPFGGGVRMCPGRNLAMAQLKIFMVLLFGRFNVELIDYSASLKTHFGLTRHCDELKLPGPLPLPLIGNLISYNDLAAWVNGLQSKYGDIGEVWIGGERAIWLGRAEYVDKVFKPSFGNYNKRTTPNKGLDILDMTSKGLLFNNNYNKWSYNQRFFSKAILAPSFVRQSVKITQSLFLEMEKYWKDLGQQNGEINMTDWAPRFFAEAILLTTTNKKFDTLNNYHKVLCATEKNSEQESLIHHVRTMIEGMEFFLMVPTFLHVLPNYNSSAKKILYSFDWMRKHYLSNLIKERRNEIEKSPIGQELTPDMLTLMLTFNTPRDKSQNDDQHPEPMADEDICGNILEAILVQSVSLFTVCHNPEVKQHIVEEIQKIFDLNSDINFEDLHKLHYCEAVIKEVSRHLTVAPVIFRMAEHSDEIDGHKFEGGLRMCPGRNLAMTELKTFMVLLFGKFNVELIDYSAPLKSHFGLTRHCDELKLKLIPRK